MHLNPYGEDPVRLALDLLHDPPTDAAGLAARVVAAGVVVDRGTTDADVRTVRDYLLRWAAVVDATDPGERAALVNELLAETSAYPRLTDHAGSGWHLHYRDADLAVGRVVVALLSVGTALHLSGRGMHRLGRCAVDGCERAFADVSRTGRQRYCSTACANRDAVRRHRARAAS